MSLHVVQYPFDVVRLPSANSSGFHSHLSSVALAFSMPSVCCGKAATSVPKESWFRCPVDLCFGDVTQEQWTRGLFWVYGGISFFVCDTCGHDLDRKVAAGILTGAAVERSKWWQDVVRGRKIPPRELPEWAPVLQLDQMEFWK